MKAIKVRGGELAEGLAEIREQFHLPFEFPPEVLAAADEAAAAPIGGHIDRTDIPFVTLDPQSSTDLDQAFAIEQAGADLILRYAIADVSAFVAPVGPVDAEAWARGETFYLPDGRIGLYPPVLSEAAASLLPDGPRPAIIFSVRVEPGGRSVLDGAERALIHSRAKLGYATVTSADLPPGFDELARRVTAAEDARGAARVEPPQQQVIEEKNGTFHLGFRPMSAIEQSNAALSLACNLAIADLMLSAGTGLFRVMRDPGQRAVSRLRHTATALGLDWPTNLSLDQRARSLDPNERKDALFMLAIRRAGQGATYQPFTAGERPWHSAMAATYAHGTAPLRRLADRYVNEAALALSNGKPVPGWVADAFPLLAPVMNRADARANQVDGAVIELAEAVVLRPRVGETFEGCVVDVDDRGARVQLCEEPVLTRIADGALKLGDRIRLRLVEANPKRRLTRFELT